ncbi:MAG TPA: hypothetical protein VEF55_14115 [Candidatus Binatia bacterium]|nr:hypothetical protein [Candidatus Binatia bacterium]
MRAASIALGLLLVACGQAEPPPPLPEPPQAARMPTWFICDAIDAPMLLVFERDGTTARVAQYEKPSGAIVQRTTYEIGDQEGAAGSVYTTLIQNGMEAGAIRQINPGMLETPGAAYTTPFTSVRLGAQEISCRWMPRTRLMGFTGRRTVVVSEDADGDLLYTSYDFASAAAAQQIELSDNGRSTTFSLEARDGQEEVGPNGATYTFQADSETTIAVITDNGAGRIEVRRHGPNPAQTEDLTAYIEGTAE